MCGRFASALKPSDAWLELMQDWPAELFNRYNVSPTSQIGAFVDGRCHAMRWGLIPSWSKELSTRYATFNARIETIESKPAFRHAWSHDQKCLIPALGYYEWQIEQGAKQPYFVTSDDGQPMVFAGLWDECQFGGEPLQSCTIITTDTKSGLKNLHNRMPVMLSVDSAKQWLAASHDKEKLIAGCLTDFRIYKVDRRVNNAREEGEELIQPI
jgi:putative SOS response-associated peptidase YedK